MRPSSTPSDMPSPTDMYETSVVDLMESPKCFRSAGRCSRGRDHGDAVAELEHQVRIGEQHGVSPRRTSTIFASTPSGNVNAPNGTPVNAARETKNLAMSSALRSLARRPDSARPSCCRASSIAPGSPNSSSTSPASSRISGSGSRVGPSLPNRHEPHARRQAGDHLADRDALPLGGQHHFDCGRRRRRRRPGGPEPCEKTRRCRGWADHTDRIGHGVPDRRATGRRPHRSRPAASACWSAPRQTCPGRAQVTRRTRRPPPTATAERAQHRRRAQRIPLQPIAAQAGKKLPAVLNPDAVEEHDEADRSDERRRRRLRRDRAERQSREQDGADVEREARRPKSGRWRSRGRWPQRSPASATARGDDERSPARASGLTNVGSGGGGQCLQSGLPQAPRRPVR